MLACRRLAKATGASALEAQAFGVKQRGTLMLPAILRHGQEDLPVPELEVGAGRKCHVGQTAAPSAWSLNRSNSPYCVRFNICMLFLTACFNQSRESHKEALSWTALAW